MINNKSDFFSKKKLRILVLSILFILIIIFLINIKTILLPFIIAVLLAYLFNPVVIYLEKNNFSRKKALILLSALIFNLMIIIILFLVPRLLRELKNFIKVFPEYILLFQNNMTRWNNFLSNYFSREILGEFSEDIFQIIEDYISLKINDIIKIIMNSINVFFSFLGAPVITYYILRDIDTIKKRGLRIIPTGKKTKILNFIREVNNIFSGYLRGQAWLSLIIALLVSIGLYFLQIKFYLIFGLIAGITNIIPYIGPVLGAFPAVLFAFLFSPLQAIGSIILYFLVQEIESSFIQPKIMSQNVGLHPLSVIFSLLAGADLFGLWGLIFAVPLAGILKSFIMMLIEFLFPLDEVK